MSGISAELVQWIRAHKFHSQVMPKGVFMTTSLVHADVLRGKCGFGCVAPPRGAVPFDQLRTEIFKIAQENAGRQAGEEAPAEARKPAIKSPDKKGNMEKRDLPADDRQEVAKKAKLPADRHQQEVADKAKLELDLSGLIGDGTKKGSKQAALQLLQLKDDVRQATSEVVESLLEDEEDVKAQLDLEFGFDHPSVVRHWIKAGQLSVEEHFKLDDRGQKMVVGLFACKNLHERLTNQLSEFSDEDQQEDQEDDDWSIEDLVNRMTAEFELVDELDDPDWHDVDFLEKMQEAFDQEH